MTQYSTAPERAQQLAEEAIKLLKQAKALQHQAHVDAARVQAYQQHSDGLAFQFLAACAEYGEHSPQAGKARERWLGARNAIKAQFPRTSI
ncbi:MULTISPECIES: hypothetical protein [Pseudoalteromonas]|uniref:Uncharacterized protein n=1 Tax=Pseudoalteromonas rubra TaxID=43658 RepID=A0A5S3URH8_9GAMM|nr:MULTISPECIES: hypothetical protein [Pseudoalteromonas]MCG7560779.1 hypothetical protein [Pseudoalteromonas sp. McH1-42]MEC4090564.1 hypothetical protein [Pseudoalteromonas rubra]QPB82488.1 hypothetical protein CWC22_005595 [Pseudoalteromonas rubra]